MSDKPQVFQQSETTTNEDNWTLTSEQMIFMLQYNNYIEEAFRKDDFAALQTLADSEEYQQVFGDMSFDEAFDRYETTVEDAGGNA